MLERKPYALTPCMPSRNPTRPALTKPRFTRHPTEGVVETRGASHGLVLAEHGMRLQVPLLMGLVVDPLVPAKEPQESTP
jgi:hypothetical protein